MILSGFILTYQFEPLALAAPPNEGMKNSKDGVVIG